MAKHYPVEQRERTVKMVLDRLQETRPCRRTVLHELI